MKSINRKNKLYKKYASSPTICNKRKLSQYRNTLTTLLRNAKKQYYTDLLDEHKYNLKQTWNVLNNLLGRSQKNALPTTFKINNMDQSNPEVISNSFNNYFTNIGPNLADKIPTGSDDFKKYLKNVKSPVNSLFLLPIDKN